MVVTKRAAVKGFENVEVHTTRASERKNHKSLRHAPPLPHFVPVYRHQRLTSGTASSSLRSLSSSSGRFFPLTWLLPLVLDSGLDLDKGLVSRGMPSVSDESELAMIFLVAFMLARRWARCMAGGVVYRGDEQRWEGVRERKRGTW